MLTLSTLLVSTAVPSVASIGWRLLSALSGVSSSAGTRSGSQRGWSIASGRWRGSVAGRKSWRHVTCRRRSCGVTGRTLTVS